VVHSKKLITFLIVNGPPISIPEELDEALKRRGWQTIRPGQIYAIYWDCVLNEDPSDANKLMERVMHIHKLATQHGITHTFKTVKTTAYEARYPEIV